MSETISDIEDTINYEINNNGGITELFIFDRNKNLLGFGESICSEKDNFSKKVAISISLGRALKDAQEKGLM